MRKILIIDDERDLCRSLEIQLRGKGYEVRSAHDEPSGLAAARDWAPAIILLDLRLGSSSGLKVLAKLQADQPAPAVIMITAQQDMKATIEAARLGVDDYLRKPFSLDDLLQALAKIEAGRRRDGADVVPLEPIAEDPREIVGADPKIIEVLKQIGVLSRSRVTVLIEGESGVGKEAVARALHGASTPDEPFVAINCSSVVPTLLESELFGHEKGAFTSASQRKLGKFEQAGAGVVFLDEVGDLGLDLQAKLLRVLQEREFERVGGLDQIALEARVITATHRNLREMTTQGQFREDLYFRLAVSRLELPPLRQRRGDIRLLTIHLLNRIAAGLDRPIAGIEAEALRRLEERQWPGNVRELENVLTRAAAMAASDTIRADELVFDSPDREQPGDEDELSLAAAEIDHIAKVLAGADWNITRSAALLEISPTTLRKKIADHGLERPP